eukprot:Protomagalhaensia_sp_Gyna_25__5911@NODE_8_length_9128_cov_36_250523_g6_i1_p5_GENE_NODE_8_length_9128_cov_36_250523_g6_i1NODE_8_length_9128_cov_36_250523_g6_i1_p5_ORF_typecomplete_len308_score63_46Podoplanin/PF05808_11/0_0017_NODE_8_length_9128_cov_36_250523_g6_i170317954
MRQLVVAVALWSSASAVNHRLRSPFLPWPCEEGMSASECNQVRQCERLTRDSELASNVWLDCEELGDCLNSNLVYCSAQACRDYHCGSNPNCILNFLPVGITCAWQCRSASEDSDDSDEYTVNCITGEPINLTPPTTKSPSSSTTILEGEALPPSMSSTTSSASSSSFDWTTETTTLNVVPAGLPTTVACVGIVGGAAGMGIYLLGGGSSGGVTPEIVTEASFQDFGPAHIDDFEAVEDIQDDGDPDIENKLENMFEAVQGTNEEKTDVASKLLQMSEGNFSSGEGGALSSEIANKFMEDMISPFYK